MSLNLTVIILQVYKIIVKLLILQILDHLWMLIPRSPFFKIQLIFHLISWKLPLLFLSSKWRILTFYQYDLFWKLVVRSIHFLFRCFIWELLTFHFILRVLHFLFLSSICQLLFNLIIQVFHFLFLSSQLLTFHQFSLI